MSKKQSTAKPPVITKVVTPPTKEVKGSVPTMRNPPPPPGTKK